MDLFFENDIIKRKNEDFTEEILAEKFIKMPH